MYRRPETRTLTIAAGASQSDPVYLGQYMVAEIQMPGTWDTASITALTSATRAGTYNPKYDSDGNELTISAAASRAIGLTGDEAEIIGSSLWLKLRSGTAGTPVNQTAGAVITLVLK